VIPAVTQTDNPRAVFLMLGAMAAFAVEDLFLKRAAMVLPPGQVVAMLGAAGAMIYWVIAVLNRQPILTTEALRGAALIRALSEAGSTMLYVPALALIPLTMNSALLQASPLVVTLGAAFFLGETVGWRRWSAILVGFVGVLIVLQPWNAAEFHPAGLLTVACVLVLAARDLSTRAMPARIGTFQLATWAYMALVPAGLTLMAIMRDAPAPVPRVLWLDLGAALIMGLFGYFGVTLAMRLGEVAVVAPYRYARLVFAALIAMVFLGERPGLWTWVGSGLIIGSGLYTFARARRLRARSAAAQNSPPAVD
jgi:drug/metabolite transporter (DMT)-like permease